MQSVQQDFNDLLTTPIAVPTVQAWRVTVTHRDGRVEEFTYETPWSREHWRMLDAVKALHGCKPACTTHKGHKYLRVWA